MSQHPTVILSYSCKYLGNLDMDIMDAQIIILLSETQQTWQEIGRTEILKDRNPNFSTKTAVFFKFEVLQVVKFVIVHVTNKTSTKLEDQQIIGEVQSTLSKLVCAGKSQFNIRRQDSDQGILDISCDEVPGYCDEVELCFRATNLDKKELLRKSDPMLVISRWEGIWQQIHKTEFYKHQLDVQFLPFKISVQQLCRGDPKQPIRFEIYDHHVSKDNELIGGLDMTLEKLLQSSGTTHPLIHEELRKRKSKYKDSGTLHIDSVKLEKHCSMVQLLRGGYKFSFNVAIDFTSSNGDITKHDSLHFRGPNNSYENSIRSVTQVVESFTDGGHAVYGFGAKIPPTNEVSHCFAANFNETSPYVNGVEELIHVYYNALLRVYLHGPTNLSFIISKVAKRARDDTTDTYYILLIITDGVVTDHEATINEIINASDLPLSIIIVGVGNDAFNTMNDLCPCGKPLSYQGRSAARNIVTFVPYRSCISQYLATKLLEEVPSQFQSWIKLHNKQPPINNIRTISFTETPKIENSKKEDKIHDLDDVAKQFVKLHLANPFLDSMPTFTEPMPSPVIITSEVETTEVSSTILLQKAPPMERNMSSQPSQEEKKYSQSPSVPPYSPPSSNTSVPSQQTSITPQPNMPTTYEQQNSTPYLQGSYSPAPFSQQSPSPYPLQKTIPYSPPSTLPYSQQTSSPYPQQGILSYSSPYNQPTSYAQYTAQYQDNQYEQQQTLPPTDLFKTCVNTATMGNRFVALTQPSYSQPTPYPQQSPYPVQPSISTYTPQGAYPNYQTSQLYGTLPYSQGSTYPQQMPNTYLPQTISPYTSQQQPYPQQYPSQTYLQYQPYPPQ
jgi:hypothetical protein